jgi:hypothetical protein
MFKIRMSEIRARAPTRLRPLPWPCWKARREFPCVAPVAGTETIATGPRGSSGEKGDYLLLAYWITAARPVGGLTVPDADPY